ncbi:hypothetical protein [Candidatus Borrarchaeum sp.]|jgi:tetratricopeptide (TPR) repeat protein|nr:hypothetical protein [Candidatus Borrarchaeum sp.]
MFTNESPEAYLEKREEYLNQGEYEKAIKEYENVLNADPNFFMRGTTL